MKRQILLISILSLVICGCKTEKPQPKQSPPFIREIFPSRFAVLEVTPHGEPRSGKQTVVLRLKPHYGKIDQQSLDFRLEHETQELSLVTLIDTGYEIKKGDIIRYEAYKHLKFGSRQ